MDMIWMVFVAQTKTGHYFATLQEAEDFLLLKQGQHFAVMMGSTDLPSVYYKILYPNGFQCRDSCCN